MKLLNRLYPPVLIKISGSGNGPKKNKLLISLVLFMSILFLFFLYFSKTIFISSLNP